MSMGRPFKTTNQGHHRKTFQMHSWKEMDFIKTLDKQKFYPEARQLAKSRMPRSC